MYDVVNREKPHHSFMLSSNALMRVLILRLIGLVARENAAAETF